jgi:Protein of unknown function (DUF2934)
LIPPYGGSNPPAPARHQDAEFIYKNGFVSGLIFGLSQARAIVSREGESFMMFLSPEAEQKIRVRAHEIWEAEGRPDGQHLEHWRQALSEFERDKAGQAGSAAPAAPLEQEKKSPGPAE